MKTIAIQAGPCLGCPLRPTHLFVTLKDQKGRRTKSETKPAALSRLLGS